MDNGTFRHTYRVCVLFLGMMCISEISMGQLGFAAERIKAHLEVEDVLTLPGERVQLKAWLVSQELPNENLGISDEEVEFFIQNRAIGTSKTGRDGNATIEFVPRVRGNLTLKARVRGSSKVADLEALGLLASWEKRRPILIVDLVSLLPPNIRTLSSSPSVPLATSGTSILADPNTNALPELEKLGKFYYNLVYLSRSKAGSVKVLRKWLQEHEFPLGVPMAIEPGTQSLITFIEKLQSDGWENVESGIGRSTEFAEVLLERRIQTVIIQEAETDETFPRRAKIVNGWMKVRRHL
ncbi:MAG: hypothetical protein ACPGYT_03755 [Nitrospirales bacterium]